jgi:hypothetical protein
MPEHNQSQTKDCAQARRKNRDGQEGPNLGWSGVPDLLHRLPAGIGREVFKSIGAGIMDIATGFGDFFTNLVA